MPTVALASVQTVTERMDRDVVAINGFVDAINESSDETALDVTISEAEKLVTTLRDSLAFYRAETQSSELTAFITAEESMITAVSDLREAAINQDATGIDEAFVAYDKAVDAINAAGEAYASANYVDYRIIFMVLAGVAVACLAGAGFVAFRNQTALRSAEQRMAEMQLFRSSLVPLAGVAISWIWYELTPEGGTFVVFWGLIAAGFAFFLRDVYVYITRMRAGFVAPAE
jgi:hypothetical protein